MVFEFAAFGGTIATTAIASFLLLIYVIYDVIISEEMLLIEKAIWIILAGNTGFIGIFIYLYFVKYRKELLADHTDIESLQERFLDGSDISKLERLSDLKEEGVLTEEEFEEKKQKILDKQD